MEVQDRDKSLAVCGPQEALRASDLVQRPKVQTLQHRSKRADTEGRQDKPDSIVSM